MSDDRMPAETLTADDDACLIALSQALAGARATGDRQLLIEALARAHALLPRLPAAFRPVLEGIEQRLESSAMFGEESCSFSLTDLFEALDTWLERARRRLIPAAK